MVWQTVNLCCLALSAGGWLFIFEFGWVYLLGLIVLGVCCCCGWLALDIVLNIVYLGLVVILVMIGLLFMMWWLFAFALGVFVLDVCIA